jgi:CheY-like chemotaxis protein
VVEDNAVNRMLVVAILRRAGYSVETAPNGLAGLLAAAANDYDLILMDIHMPEMDGIEATRRIRALPGNRARVPIVALTANAVYSDREACITVGMDDHIGKPIDASIVLGRVAHHALRRRATAAA